MALGTPATIPGQQGQTTMRPNGILRMQFVGDNSYPAGGTADFATTYLRAELARDVTVTQVSGYGFTAGAITHVPFYDASNDKLLMYVLATGAEAAPGDLSAVLLDVEVHYR